MPRPSLAAAFSRGLGRLPTLCAVCRSWPSRPVCDACVARFAPPLARCRRCAIPVFGGIAQCGQCAIDPPPLDACIAACSYGWPWAGPIGRFKFQGEAGWAAAFATLMRSAPWAEPLLDRADRVLPMPLAPGRLRERGFNQSWELARRLAPGKCDASMLLRTRETRPQSGFSRTERLRNLQGAFALAPQHLDAVRGRQVVLVDDVMTSGASLYECARTLRQHGALGVSAIVLARTGQSDHADAPDAADA